MKKSKKKIYVFVYPTFHRDTLILPAILLKIVSSTLQLSNVRNVRRTLGPKFEHF